MHVGQKFEGFQLLKVPSGTTKMLKMSSFTSEILELSIAAAKSRLSNKTLDEKLKYYEITFHCIKGRKKLKFTAAGALSRSIPPFIRLVVPVIIIVSLICFGGKKYKSMATGAPEFFCLSIIPPSVGQYIFLFMYIRPSIHLSLRLSSSSVAYPTSSWNGKIIVLSGKTIRV